MNKPKKRLLDQVRDKLRLRHYSIRTEHSYISWIKRYILFHNKRHPQEMGTGEIEEFLTHLVLDLKVASSTQNQAFNALQFLYRQVLNMNLDDQINAVRAKRPLRLPTVMSKDETLRVIRALDGVYRLMAMLLYGSGVRLMECVRLRVEDVDFSLNQIIVRDGKGTRDRATVLPENAKPGLKDHLQKVKLLHQDDLAKGYGRVYLPYALEKKYPTASRDWGWQYVFPSKSLSRDPRSGEIRRHHNQRERAS